MNTEEKKKEILSVQLVGIKSYTSNSYGRNMPYMRYKVFITRRDEQGELYQREISDVFTDTELKDLGYWSNRSLSMSMRCWGTSQYFEAQLALGRFIFGKQKQSEEWGDYTRRLTSLIKEL